MRLIQNIDLNISDQELRILLPILAGFIAYCIYWFTQESVWIKNKLTSKFGKEKASITLILSGKYLGAVCMGILPFLAYKIAFPEVTLMQLGFGISRSTLGITLFAGLGIGMLMGLILFMNAGKESIQKKHPEIRVSLWNRKLVFQSLFAWAIYLLGYEFFFRGVLFFPLLEYIGLWPAVAVNILFYAGVHIPKGADEAILAIPFAVVISLITAATGNIWTAYLVHVIMAWTITLASIRKNPDMRFVKMYIR